MTMYTNPSGDNSSRYAGNKEGNRRYKKNHSKDSARGGKGYGLFLNFFVYII